MSGGSPLPGWLRGAGALRAVARRDLNFARLAMAEVPRGRLLPAVRLQLTQYMPAGPFAFVCHPRSGGQVEAWAWSLPKATGSGRAGAAWPEPLLDPPGAPGLRLLQRDDGFEAQHWNDGELTQTRWFAALPDDAAWQLFARGCGLDPAQHPRPAAQRSPRAARPQRGWLAGDNLPPPDPWQGWQWQLAALLLACATAWGAGLHVQAVQQLAQDQQKLQALRSGREATLAARARYEQVDAERQALKALSPRLLQLELLDRLVASGIFEAPRGQPDGVPTRPGPSDAAAAAAAPANGGRVQLIDWDFRNGRLKMTLELPDNERSLLDITRRVEQVAGLGDVRVGQDSSGTALTLTATVPELLPLPGSEVTRSGAAAR